MIYPPCVCVVLCSAWVALARKSGGLGPQNLNIPLLADTTHQLSKDYGVYLEEEGHTLRGLFLINDQGVLKHMLHNSPEAGRSVDETLRLVQAYQYAAVHGEVCPAGWQPGSATIKPTPQQKGKDTHTHTHIHAQRRVDSETHDSSTTTLNFSLFLSLSLSTGAYFAAVNKQ